MFDGGGGGLEQDTNEGDVIVEDKLNEWHQGIHKSTNSYPQEKNW